jgi:uncharacterized protein YyaL (SSP411 family)
MLALLAAGGLRCREVSSPAGPTPPDPDSAPHAATQPDRPAGDPELPGLGPPSKAMENHLAAALHQKGPAYRPRTRHLLPGGQPRFTNRLILETSPYLLQHAHNPVNWYRWGDEPFERARKEGKPVLVSVGYSTCHWCHVMERESFEDEEIAAYLNTHFVCIKVDREERPDVDELYMGAVQLITGRGGWPMTVVMTPDRRPFFAGTYFPPRDGGPRGGTGFLTVLREIISVHKGKPERIRELATRVTERLQAVAAAGRPGDLPGPPAIRSAAQELAEAFDPVHGGFGGAPKFPTPPTLMLLARYHRRTGDPQALRMLVLTLTRMARGGIRDQIGGGFHRYATDRAWQVPHFEKMLYDNAQLAVVYLEAHQLTGRADLATVAREILDELDQGMSHPDGGFFSAFDADSPVPGGAPAADGGGHAREHEGWFYTWTPAELAAVLDAEHAAAVTTFFGVTPAGNFEGRNILHVAMSPELAAAKLGTTPAALERTLAEARGQLAAARARRPPPLRDDKVIASWNGLALSAFARGAMVLGEPRYAARAVRAADFMLQRMRTKDGLLHRTYREGQARNPGILDDHAFVAQGLLDLFEATHEPRWLSAAVDLHELLARRFLDRQHGGFFLTALGDEKLLTRSKPQNDGAEPSGNSVAMLNLLRLAELSGKPAHRQEAERGLRALATAMKSGSSAALLLSALDFYLDTPLEIALVAPVGGSAAALEQVVHRAFVPNRVLLVTSEGAALGGLAPQVPLLEGKVAQGGRPTAYVCREQRCELPTTDPVVLARQLARVTPLFATGAPAPLPVASPAP